jgi:hypothetical protein
VAGGVLGLAVLGGGLYALLGSGQKPASTATIAATPAPAPAASAVVAPPAPIAPPAPVAQTPAPPPFDPLKDFERVASLQSADFGVEAVTSKPRFRIDKDFLSFSVKAEKEGHLYVFLLGSDGVLMQVFPNATAKSNRIRAGQTLVLPPPQSNWAMKASGPAGVDHFIAIVSAFPRDFSAVGLQVQDGYGQASVAAVADAAQRDTSGKPIFLGKPVCPTSDCADQFGAALFASEQVQ